MTRASTVYERFGTLHVYEPAQDEDGRVRWTCRCGRVGRFRARRPYVAWRKHLPGAVRTVRFGGAP